MHSPTEPPRRAGRQPAEHGAGGQRAALGRLGERLAAEHLMRLGFSVVAQNVRTRAGEIDLIAFDGRTLVFAEVKTRRARGVHAAIREHQAPLPGLRPVQRARLRRLALAWLSDESRVRRTARTIRFDAVGVVVDGRERLIRLEHLEGAW